MKKVNPLCLILLGTMGMFTEVAYADFDVIINPSAKLAQISKSEIKQILLANTIELDKKKIYIIALSPDSPEADALMTEAMGMSAVQAKKHWLTKVFNGVLAIPPPALDTLDEVVERVATTQGAIAIIPKGAKPGKAKLLKVK